MDLKELKRVSDGIVPPTKDLEKMLIECQREFYIRKSAKRKKRAIVLSIVIAMFVFVQNLFTGPTEIAVYAATATANIRLQKNEKIILERQNTPMGSGYVFHIEIPGGQYTYTLTDENSQYPQNVFHKGDEIYWLPDGMADSFRNEEGGIIELPKVSKSVINIQILMERGKEEVLQLSLSQEKGGCSVILTEVNK